MSNNKKTLGIIHASSVTINPITQFAKKYLPNVSLMHLCDDTIQRDNISAGAGHIPKVNYFKFAQYAHNLEEASVDMILLACSTFNYAAELARPMINVPIMQIDRPMMKEAVHKGKKIGLLGTLATTMPSSERLLRIVAEEEGKDITVHSELVEEAFVKYSAGDIDGHNQMLLEKLGEMTKTCDCIVLAQLSMSALKDVIISKNYPVPVFNSGDTCFSLLKDDLEA